MNSSEQPTRVRFVVIATVTLMSMLLYLDRFCISFAEIYIKEDLGLSDSQVAWMLSAFFWTYALGQVPSGWLTDRFGSRIMLTVYVFSWSLFTGLTGAASAFAAILLLRLGFGVGQAGAYPTASSIVSRWATLPSRGTMSAFVALGGRVGGFLALFATGYVIVWLTPSDISPELANDDLLEPRSICVAMAEADEEESPDNAIRALCLAQMSPEAKSLVARFANVDAEDSAKSEGKPAAQPDESLSAQEVSLLRSELNRIVASRGEFTADRLRKVAIEKEGKRMLPRLAQLSDYENQRLNRLVLEAVFRTGIRKLYVAGWRPMMVLYGAFGIIVCSLIWWSCRTTPGEHPWVNEAEVELISGGRPPDTGKIREPAPVRALLTSRSMWLSCFSQWFTNIGWVFLMTWAPRYFATVHQVPTETRAWMTAVPPLIGWIGMLSGGLLTDVSVSTVGLRWGRALPMSLSRFLAMAAYLGCLFHPGPWTAVALFSVVAFATDLGTAPTWAFMQDVGGKHVGSVLGWGNMWGNLGAAVAPHLVIWIIGPDYQWDYAFAACAASFLLAGVCAIGINATIPIAPVDEKS